MTHSIPTLRRHVYECLHNIAEGRGSNGAETSGLRYGRIKRTIRGTIDILIVLNILVVMLESVKRLEQRWSHWFFIIDFVSVLVFSVEYGFRVWSVTESEKYSRPILGRLRWMKTPQAIFDLLAILPFFVHMTRIEDLRVLRGFRLLRLERILIMGRYSAPLRMMMDVLRSKKQELVASMFIMGVVLIMASSLMYFFEHEAQPELFPDIPSSLWWAVVTLTSVGYGDVYPITPLGKLVGGMIALLGIGVVALPSGIIVAGLVERMADKNEVTYCPSCGAVVIDVRPVQTGPTTDRQTIAVAGEPTGRSLHAPVIGAEYEGAAGG